MTTGRFLRPFVRTLLFAARQKGRRDYTDPWFHTSSRISLKSYIEPKLISKIYRCISFMSFVIFLPLPLNVSFIAFPYQTQNFHDVMARFPSLVRENGTHGGTQRLTKGVCRSVHIYFRRIEMLSPLLVDC